MATTTVYLDFGASVAKAVYEDASPPPTPAGATVITQAQYDTKSATLKAATAALRNARKTTQANNAAADYAALITAGIPAATAQRLTGHNGA